VDENYPERFTEQAKALALLLSAHCYMAELANKQNKARVDKTAVVEWRRYKREAWWSVIDWNALRCELEYWEKLRRDARSSASLESELRRILKSEGDRDVMDTLKSVLVESGEVRLNTLMHLRDFMINWVTEPIEA
jgi:hypothetical protein